MRDFKKDSSAQDNLSRFGRDKREQRTGNNRNEERRPRSQRDAADSDYSRPERSERPRFSDRSNGGDRPERRSFNPNFSRDNRPTTGAGRSDRPERKSYGDKPAYGERKQFSDRPERGRSFGDKPAYGEKKQYGDRPNRKPFNGERKPFSTDRKPFNADRKPYARKNFEEKDGASYPKYDPNRQSGEMRLNRYLAQSGLCSRREADDYIAAGVVTVNGNVVTELGTKVMPTDEVKFNDSRVVGEKKVYLVLNKPKGYVTSNDDPHADKTVMDLVREGCSERIYPVGRLDKNSVGLLLFTNDGDLTKQLTHPSHKKKKIYQVSLNAPLTRADMDSIAQGITLEDGEIYADAISYVKEDKTEVGVEIHSGRNRIVRRIFEHLGYSVQKLDRVYYAGLTKKNLKRGQWRFLTADEVDRLKSGRYE